MINVHNAVFVLLGSIVQWTLIKHCKVSAWEGDIKTKNTTRGKLFGVCFTVILIYVAEICINRSIWSDIAFIQDGCEEHFKIDFNNVCPTLLWNGTSVVVLYFVVYPYMVLKTKGPGAVAL